MSVFESPDCKASRTYAFRRLRGPSFRFRVKAAHDASVCLSPTASEAPSDGLYEVFLGAWEGKQSAIRRNKRADVCKVSTPNLLSADEFRGFWVVVSGKSIKVGREGSSTPFMTHTEPLKDIKVTHYGYCTAYGATGCWTFSDDDPTQYESKFDVSDLIGAINQVPCKTPVLGFVPPTTCRNPVRKDKNKSLEWVKCHNGFICTTPVQVVHGVKQPLVALAYHNGGLLPGVFIHENSTCYISFSGRAIAKNEYYLLSNTEEADLIWQAASNGVVPTGAVQGGYSETGEPLYIGRCAFGKNFSSGKVHPSHEVCYVPYWGSEYAKNKYDVLCLRTVPLGLLGIK